jgi:hypothetical protein
MNPEIEVDTEELRRAASALAGTASEATTSAATPPSIPRTPRWHTTDAATLAVEAAQQQLRQLGADLAETARQVTAAAAAYQEADARAATRLRLSR